MWRAPGLADESRTPLRPELHIQGNDWSAEPADIEKVLRSAADQLLPYFPGRTLKPILVSRRQGVPMTLDQRGPAGEYQVKLGTGNTYWAQYAYQFAHELCHVLAANGPMHRGKHQWFEESLCETSSLFVLGKMHHAWDTHPPYPNWRSWGVHFDEYLNQMLADRTRRLPPDQTMAQWMTRHLPELVKEQSVTDHSELVAAYLLELFQDEPQGWECITWLNAGDDDALDFPAHLQAWKSRVPEKDKQFIGKIQKLFGYSL